MFAPLHVIQDHQEQLQYWRIQNTRRGSQNNTLVMACDELPKISRYNFLQLQLSGQLFKKCSAWQETALDPVTAKDGSQIV